MLSYISHTKVDVYETKCELYACIDSPIHLYKNCCGEVYPLPMSQTSTLGVEPNSTRVDGFSKQLLREYHPVLAWIIDKRDPSGHVFRKAVQRTENRSARVDQEGPLKPCLLPQHSGRMDHDRLASYSWFSTSSGFVWSIPKDLCGASL